jgi:hypothetical protein
MVTILVLGSNFPLSAVATSTVLQCYQCNIDSTVEILGGTLSEISGGTGVSLLAQPLAMQLLQTFQPGTTISLLLHVFYLDGSPVDLSPQTATFSFYSGQPESTLLTLQDVPVVPQSGAGPGYYLYNFTIPKDWSAGGVSVSALAQSLHDANGNSNSGDSAKALMSLEVVAAQAAFNIASYTVPIIILILLLIALLVAALLMRRPKKKT